MSNGLYHGPRLRPRLARGVPLLEVLRDWDNGQHFRFLCIYGRGAVLVRQARVAFS
jgi:hypothetical protein